MIAALPGWRYKDIIRLPIPVVELAANASENRRSEQNKFLAAIHGIKLEEPKQSLIENSKENVQTLKTTLLSGHKVSKITPAELANFMKNKAA